MRKIDHIVFAVKDLQEGSAYIQSLLGCQVIPGGKHLNNGTHNAVVNLGNNIYLEIIAADPGNNNVPKPRWMGVDVIDQSTVTRWAIKSDDLAPDLATLKKYNPALATSFAGSRKKQDGSTLSWNMALPLPSPTVEIAPFITDWKDSIHPTATLPEECELMSIEFYASELNKLKQLFSALAVEYDIQSSNVERIKLKIKSPNGLIEL